ncbi:MAG: hypothetical protein V7749_00940 [Cocleimonas sp.]
MAVVRDWFNSKEFIVPSEHDGADFDHWSYNSDHTLITCFYWNRDELEINTKTGTYILT